ncbi:MAG: hypothetical protein OXC06_18255, partial [Acidimicrobiaceae bacterium]|nr:hypothetical protein [Acidimicrobiaceae bacterium]
GLLASYDATVGVEVSFEFTFSPSAATPSVGPVSLSGLEDLALTRRGDTATVSGTPTRAGAYTATIALTQNGHKDTFTTTINASCAADDVEHTDRSCVAPATVTNLKQRHDATVDAPFSVGFNYEPDDARVSVSVSPSGFSLIKSDRSGLFAGSAGLAGTPTLAGTYKVTITLTQTGRVDDHTFTVVAACPQGHTQQSDRSCEAPICPAGSWGSLGLDNRTVATTASWGATDCTSKNRQPGRHARYYTFTLGAAADVAIDLSSQHDTYLYLMSGLDTRSGFLHRNNDIAGHDRNSRILKRLPAGRYTVEATTYSANKTGRFKVQARVVAAPDLTDFISKHDVTVGQPFSIEFDYRPAAAQLTTTVHPSTLTITDTDTAGAVTITATPRLAGTYTITLRFAQPGRTDTRTITINATCPTGQAPSLTGSGVCESLAPVPAGCSVTELGTRTPWWGRVYYEGPYLDYGTSAPAACTSLSQSGARAKYWRFTVPVHQEPGGISAQVGLEIEKLKIVPVPLEPEANSGYPSLTLWKYRPTLAPITPRAMQRVASGTSRQGALHPTLDASLTPGDYLIEIAPTRSTVGLGRYGLAVTVPTAESVHDDVKKLGNTGLNGRGLTLAQFLAARGSLAKSSGGGNFDPPSTDYPWLPFTSDGCSIPVDIYQLEDHAPFHGGTVSFLYACLRHDFNWRNLHRVKHHLQHNVGDVWTGAVSRETNGRLGEDLNILCNANQPGFSQTSVHYTWTLSQLGVDDCEASARAMKFAVGLVPFPRIGSGYTH